LSFAPSVHLCQICGLMLQEHFWYRPIISDKNLRGTDYKRQTPHLGKLYIKWHFTGQMQSCWR
jgi:hypothetical protein